MHHQKLENYRENKLDEMTIAQLQKEMETGNLTSEELVLMYKENISLRDKNTYAVLEINPDALLTAQALDFERKHKGPRSKLHGIPLLVKDNMDTGDKMHTSAGSFAMADHYALRDAKIVENLHAAGAIILGKTNMTEWANFMSDKMTNGYSSRGGQVKNPYGAFDVGGSSSGSAAGVASNLASAAVGTETSGSIINPAAQNSLVGIKPTIGLISRTGIIPLSHTQDTAGPLARTVEDAVAVFAALIGTDPEDEITRFAEQFKDYNWQQHLKEDGLSGAVFGVDRQLYTDITDEQSEVFEKAIEQLRACGAVIKEFDLGADQEDLGFAVLLHEFKADLNAYLARSNPNHRIRSMSDIISYNKEHAERMLKFGQNLLEQADGMSGNLTEREYVEALERNRFLAAEQGMNKHLQQAGVDALLLPKDFGCNIGAAAGFPSITVPSGLTALGEPFGITFAGQAFDEPKLIEYAYAFEQATAGRRRPK
ncbi:amidase [Planococcus sp. CP5-4]|uniref:amidase family protein n=1 Tax=unclassified Planococcus (in: firmicutes) TaxID=2662419 RepID=UPI001C21931D|nr:MULTISPECIES: amidase family protein [unclassified Planococcus (in: firmicutes)]MBU9674862.1 amidase [Planococcus sp. CP5-4_YE]MBV0910508.1 amidase [Planococcus sp. CP5-4_UN]MBW6065291.1 amidase [Planococcus sp. CP5-4]